jgi:hypothetical protein
VDAGRLAKLIKDLHSPRFPVRQAASEALEKFDAQAEPALRQALAGAPPLEVCRRLELLLEKAVQPIHSPAPLRNLRAVSALERIGTSVARGVLETLARGGEGAWLTREARASLQRLAKRPAPTP